MGLDGGGWLERRLREMQAELFPLLPEPWREPAARRAALLAAAASGQAQEVRQAVDVYLRLVEGMTWKSAHLRAKLLGDFLDYCWRGLGRKGLALFREDPLRYAEELRARGYSPQTLKSFAYALRDFGRFLAWAGITSPSLEVPDAGALVRRVRALSEEEWREVLRALAGYRSSWTMVLLAAVRLQGELGLKGVEALALPPEAVVLEEGGGVKVRLPGGHVPLTREGAAALREYLRYREGLGPTPYATTRLLLSPQGEPVSREAYTFHLKRFRAYALLPYPVTAHALRLTGEKRLVALYGRRGAQRLLRRHLVL